MTKLTQDQEEAVRKWAKEGCGLSEIQKKLSEQFAISATYMDVRFLVIDLGAELKEKRSVPVPQINSEAAPAAPVKSESQAKIPEADKPASLPGNVVVSLDHVMRPGSVVSGTVKFSDGVSASWYLDQYGRLALDAGQPGYKPTQQDIQVFQQELKRELESRGF